ncbi:precorrin-2 C(20)-methyltransferase [Geminocystis sp. GBBB08]|uniref:precorrin-2 C(20)-methyltransferase n=1 Tax=Geminocystis sp. GBBB08 TaxID=2604140 RepID=UPI0027E35A2F|nr:precorrin-2 C(20)-methyltransferase [Geminocystis sp. GBBB08]MBL1211264.1 precorrin-2 C(20)-methyltransferase [Geminocystis sp. GBBB08]
MGTLYGVSVGTGDPELITLKGLKILQNTNIIAFPAGINHQKGVAETIIEGYLQSHQQKLSLFFPYTLSQETLSQAWYSISLEVWQYLQQGEDVAFACEGDISFYSTFTYVALTLQKIHPRIKIVRIPGVSSPMAAASALNMPLTIQQEKLAILPALYSIQELEKTLDWAEVVVLMKVASVYDQVWSILAKRNLFDCAYLVEKATNHSEKIYTCLENYPQLKLSYFSILIIRQIMSK